MPRPISIGFVFSLGLAMSSAPARDRPAGPVGPAYKVAFWYELARPMDVKYQVYDLARGEYDPRAVEGWMRTIRTRHPDHGAYVREIRTDGEPGATEKDRLAAAIDREKRRWADLNHRPSPPLPDLVAPFEPARPRALDPARSSFDRPSPGSPAGAVNPPRSPFPYPYRPRPL